MNEVSFERRPVLRTNTLGAGMHKAGAGAFLPLRSRSSSAAIERCEERPHPANGWSASLPYPQKSSRRGPEVQR